MRRSRDVCVRGHFSKKVAFGLDQALCFPFRLAVMSFSSKGQKPFVLGPYSFRSFVSIFCLQIGHLFLVASTLRAECRHSEQNK